jgi:protein gp37
MEKSSGFYKWAWDPVVGCHNGCWYCFARDKIKNFEKIRFYEDKLGEPYKVEPSLIFVNQLSDLMSPDVPQEWVQKIINVIWDLPEHEFLFLTKNPDGYMEYEFPHNCILGVTVEKPERWWRAERMLKYTNRKMCSVEPILGNFTGYDFSQFELVVVGCLIGTEDHQYYNTIKHPNIYHTR